jgi:hypothetical protein
MIFLQIMKFFFVRLFVNHHSIPIRSMSLVEHLVLFKFAAPADIVAAHSSFMQLKSQIPQIVELDFGAHLGVDAYPSMPNAVDRGDGYTHAAIVRFRTLEDLKEYIVHPAHQKWAADHSKHREVLGVFFLAFHWFDSL